MRTLTIARVCLWPALCLFLAADAHAFDYDEHKYISNVGLRIAIAASGSPHLNLMPLISTDAIARGYSFGDTVGLADYIQDADLIFERAGESDTRLDSYDQFEWKHAAYKRDWLRFLQATHANESHFQLGALTAYLDHHDAAILTARTGRIFRAMVLEAYSLHFLEDFHAPGHVATARGVLPDYVSIAVHEKYNNVGMEFRIRNGKNLKKLVEVALGLNDLGSVKNKNMPDELLLDANSFCMLDEALDGRKERFFGDSMLGKNKVQEAYLAILAAQSVLDVLTEGGENNSGPVYWCLGFLSRDPKCADKMDARGVAVALKHAATPFGEYEVSGQTLNRFAFKPGEVLLFSYYSEFALGSGIAGHAGRSEFAAESLLTSILPSRDLSQDVPKGLPTIDRYGLLAPSLLYGVSHSYGDNNSSGFHVRLLLAIPRIDVQASLAYGVRYYNVGGGRTIVAYPRDYGLEAGFGFLLLHLGLNEELTEVPMTRKFKSQRLVRSGVTVVLPKSVYLVPFHKLEGLLHLSSRDKKRASE
jgi:hypothetical protein